MHQTYFKDTPTLGAQFSTGFSKSVPVQQKICRKNHPTKQRCACCSCVFASLSVCTFYDPLLPMESLQAFGEVEAFPNMRQAHTAH